MTDSIPEPTEAPPYRSDMDIPPPRAASYPPGREPALWVHTQGRWRYAVVRQRQDWADGRIAYHVDIRLDDPSDGNYRRAYWWPQPALRAAEPPGDRRRWGNQGIDGT